MRFNKTRQQHPAFQVDDFCILANKGFNSRVVPNIDDLLAGNGHRLSLRGFNVNGINSSIFKYVICRWSDAGLVWRVPFSFTLKGYVGFVVFHGVGSCWVMQGYVGILT